jgi:hypothetical protein
VELPDQAVSLAVGVAAGEVVPAPISAMHFGARFPHAVMVSSRLRPGRRDLALARAAVRGTLAGTGLGPIIESAADGAVRTARGCDAFVAAAVHHGGDDVVEHDPVEFRFNV